MTGTKATVPAPADTGDHTPLRAVVLELLADHGPLRHASVHRRVRTVTQPAPRDVRALRDATDVVLRSLERSGEVSKTPDGWDIDRAGELPLTSTWRTTSQVAMALDVGYRHAHQILRTAHRGELVETAKRSDGVALWRLREAGTPRRPSTAAHRTATAPRHLRSAA